ncbi:MAG: hypothetical protein WC804_16075 [Sphingomonas sp.]|jgi:hypothetical protein|uniref:hypothetical protein n=1 Tax=Sphingomonas sp. TaxID=28214 RepID=UPI00356228BC
MRVAPLFLIVVEAKVRLLAGGCHLVTVLLATCYFGFHAFDLARRYFHKSLESIIITDTSREIAASRKIISC